MSIPGRGIYVPNLQIIKAPKVNQILFFNSVALEKTLKLKFDANFSAAEAISLNCFTYF